MLHVQHTNRPASKACAHVYAYAHVQGSESEGGDKEDYAEYDRDFIDDTEVHEYFGGDWHKPKHSGFYINQVHFFTGRNNAEVALQ